MKLLWINKLHTYTPIGLNIVTHLKSTNIPPILKYSNSASQLLRQMKNNLSNNATYPNKFSITSSFTNHKILQHISAPTKISMLNFYSLYLCLPHCLSPFSLAVCLSVCLSLSLTLSLSMVPWSIDPRRLMPVSASDSLRFKSLWRSSLLSAIMVVSSAYLILLTRVPLINTPSCGSSSCRRMCSL